MTRRSGAVLRRLGRRLPGLLATLGVAVLASFLVAHALPGDPVALMMEGVPADPDLVRHLRAEAGLDRPLAERFASHLLDLLRGDLGHSLRYGGTPVSAIIAETLPVTLALVGAGAALAIPSGLLIGIVAAGSRREWPGVALTVVSVFVMSVPPLALASWLMLATSGGGGWAAVMAVGLPAAAVVARMTRAQLREVLGRDFIRTARAKGLRETTVLVRHALPNALVPLAAVTGSLVGAMLTASAVVETVFALPGLGRLGIQAVLARDHPLAGAVVLVYVLGHITVSLAVDVLIGLGDPRVADAGAP